MQRPRPNEEAVREQLRELAPEPEADPEVDGEPDADAEEPPPDQPKPDEPQPDDPEPDEPDEAAPAPEEEPLAKAERERDEYLDLAQRTRAELDNFRKRAARESAQAGERAKAGLVRDLLPVIDNLERAIGSAGEAEQHLAEGVRMVHGQLVAVLEREGIEGFSPEGEPFDPTLHEALSTREAEDESGVVLDVVEKGYKLNGTVLRPARVVVSA